MRSRVSFQHMLLGHGIELKRNPVEIVQVNIGRRCNQACHHCHVEAGPKRKENMEATVVDRILELLHSSPHVRTIDITGGAPELNPHFRRLVTESRKMGLEVIDRCNLTVFFEAGQEVTPQFLREQGVHVIASLPCYSKDNVEMQRGHGVFGKSIKALITLNSLGYGLPGSSLQLDLVYNPTGPFLPPSQRQLESDYKKELKELFGIDFHRLFTITNMPIKRFLTDLEKSGQLESYMELLVNAFNPAAANEVMCKGMVSVSWSGRLFDCDFNQMLKIPTGAGKASIWDISTFDELEGKDISLADHCFACTAGAGSSCGGALT